MTRLLSFLRDLWYLATAKLPASWSLEDDE